MPGRSARIAGLSSDSILLHMHACSSSSISQHGAVRSHSPYVTTQSSPTNASSLQMSQQSLAICDSTTRDTCSSYVSSPMMKRKCRSATRMSALYQEERSPSLLSAYCWPSGTRPAARSVASMSTMSSWIRSTGKSQQIW